MLRNNVQIIESWKQCYKFYQQTAKQLGKFYCNSTDSSLNQIFTMVDQIKIDSQGLHVATATCLSLIILCFISDLALKNLFETIAACREI